MSQNFFNFMTQLNIKSLNGNDELVYIVLRHWFTYVNQYVNLYTKMLTYIILTFWLTSTMNDLTVLTRWFVHKIQHIDSNNTNKLI